MEITAPDSAATKNFSYPLDKEKEKKRERANKYYAFQTSLSVAMRRGQLSKHNQFHFSFFCGLSLLRGSPQAIKLTLPLEDLREGVKHKCSLVDISASESQKENKIKIFYSSFNTSYISVVPFPKLG